MLGLFKGRTRAASFSSSSENQQNANKVGQKESASSNNQKKTEIISSEKKEEGKEEKVSRFSFKRRKSAEKKNKKNRRDSETSSSSLTSYDASENSVTFSSEKVNTSNSSNSNAPCDSSFGSGHLESERGIVDGNDQSCSLNSNETPERNDKVETTVTVNLPSDKISIGSQEERTHSENPVKNFRLYQRKVPVYQQPDLLHLNALPSPKNSRGFLQGNEVDQSSSDGGTLSMLSTPSSSTSSLSSISSRPISPTGRRTPPGPKLGTIVRIGTSPTPTRKTSRTHIKTNPNIPGKKLSGTIPLQGPTGKESNFPFLPNTGQLTQVIGKNSNLNSGSSDLENNVTPPQSPSPSSNKPRQSVTSMHSLESIPEHGSDLQSDSKNKKNHSKSLPKIDIKLANNERCENLKCNSNQLDSLSYKSHGKNVLLLQSPTKNSYTRNSKIPIDANLNSIETNKMIVTNKPPISQPKEHEDVDEGTPVIQGLRISPLKEVQAIITQEPEENGLDHLDIANKTIHYETTGTPSAPTTHFVLSIPVLHPILGTSSSGSFRKSNSLENLTDSNRRRSLSPNKFIAFKGDKFCEDVFPVSLSSGLKNTQRSKSLSRMELSSSRNLSKQEISTVSERIQHKEKQSDKCEIKKILLDRNDHNKMMQIVNPSSKKDILKRPDCADVKISKQSLLKNPLHLKTTTAMKDRVNIPKPTLTIPQKDIKVSNISKNQPIVQSCLEKSKAKLMCHDINIQERTNQLSSKLSSAVEVTNKTIKDAESEESSSFNDISETDSVTQDSSNSQKVVQEMITIRIEDVPKLSSTKIDQISSSLEKLKEMDALQCKKEVQTDEDASSRIHIEKLLKELSSQEQKYQQQIDDLTLNLAEKQQEVSILRNKIQEVQTSFNDEDSKQQLEIRVKELKNRIQEKETAATALRSELQDLKTEHNLIQPKMKRLEDELSEAKETIVSLRDQSTSRTNDTELEVKIKNLEDQLKKSECVKKDIQETLAEIENERNEELKIVQDALDEAAQEREELIGMFEKELKTLNSKNSEREQQMLDDFEWKLREMEKNNKKKLEDKEKQAEDQLNTVRSVVESELSESLTKIAEDRRIADEKLTEVGHLRSYEAEVIQLRGVTHEFQKALRATAREMENMKIRERILDDEIRSLKKGAQSRQNTLQRAKRQVDDEEVRQKLEKLKNEINAEWEDKLRSECSRLKIELDELHAEEKHLAVESMKVQKEQEIQTLKKSFEIRQEEMTIEISRLKDSLSDKDAYYHKEMDNLRTTTDRDIWDLRMKLQKLTESSYDLKQQMEEKHKDNMERFRVDYQDRIRELEQKLERYDIQSGVDVVAQLEKEHRIQMHHVGEQHQLSMERLREELEAEKFQAVEEARVIITQHHEYIEANIKEQLEESQTNYNQTLEDLETTRQALTRKEETLRNLEDELERLAESKGDSFSTFNSSLGSNIPPATSSTSSGFSSQFSLTSSNDSQSSRNSQDRYSNSEGFLDNPDDPQKAGNGGLLGKVFGGGWFTPSKSNSRRGSTPSSSKKPYTNS